MENSLWSVLNPDAPVGVTGGFNGYAWEQVLVTAPRDTLTTPVNKTSSYGNVKLTPGALPSLSLPSFTVESAINSKTMWYLAAGVLLVVIFAKVK